MIKENLHDFSMLYFPSFVADNLGSLYIFLLCLLRDSTACFYWRCRGPSVRQEQHTFAGLSGIRQCCTRNFPCYSHNKQPCGVGTTVIPI